MPQHDPRAELAPRDIVARAIDFEMKKHGLDCVYLDITHQPADFLTRALPQHLRALPGARHRHHQAADSGGARRALHLRRRRHRPVRHAPTCPGLYAVGEAAYTGLHGANRLASNSLLECLVFAAGRGAATSWRKRPLPPPAAAAWDESRVTDADEEVVISHNWDELRRFMWDYVGIVRTNKRLERAAHRIQLLQEEIDEYYANFHVTRDLLELRNLVTVAELIVRTAQARHESRGLHFSKDYPQLADVANPTILTPGR